MSWVTILWSMTAATCLTLGGVYLLVWLRSRATWAHLLFSIGAFAAAAHAGFELALMRTTTPEQFGLVQRWLHVPIWLVVVSLVWFVHYHLNTGRAWLAWAICALRTVALGLNFACTPNLNFRAITSLRPFPLLGETVSVPIGVTNPWTLVGQLSSLLFLIYVVDAAIRAWRQGRRRPALLIGGTVAAGVTLAAGQSALLVWGIYPSPYLLSQIFLTMIVVMGLELSWDVVRAAHLSRALADSEERMTLAANAVELSLWDWDILQGAIWYTDRGAANFGAAKSDRMELSRFLNSVHPDDRDGTRQALERCLEGDGNYECEYRVFDPNGGVKWITATGRVEFDRQHKPVRLRGITMDITRRKEADQEITRRSSEVAHLSRVTTLGEISGSLAHELSQPLGAILANTEAIELHLQRPTPDLDEVRQILAEIRTDDLRAGEIIHGMRAFLRRRELQKQPLDVAQFAGEAIRLVSSDANTRQTTVTVDIPPGLPPVMGDRIHLQQVLINLLVNGLDAMSSCAPADRRLTVQAGQRDAGTVEIAVSDAGAGVPPGSLERIFEPFHTTKPSGLGLGLAICRSIVEAHGGTIVLANNPGRGASARFTLPVCTESSRP